MGLIYTKPSLFFALVVRDELKLIFEIAVCTYMLMGLEEKFDDSMEARMRRQTEQALGLSDVAIMVVDGRAGLTPIDHHFAQWLRKQKKPVILLVNKCEQDQTAANSELQQ